MRAVRDFSRCPRCNAATEKATAFSGAASEFWYTCTKCNTYINTYIPMPHQAAVHQDAHRYVGNFGGYGTGKTTTSREEVYKHIFITPKGNTLIGANVTSQYEQTIKREIEADIPEEFIEEYSAQKSYMDFVNGHRVMYRPFDDPEKLRSYNLSMFVIVEASETKQDAFTQLKTRTRNMSASVPKRDEKGNIIYKQTKSGVPIPEVEADWRKGIIESNPDSGWIRSDVLMVSDIIHKHGPITDDYKVLSNEQDPNIATHVAATEVNEFLPVNFINELCKNKPLWWVNRYIFGSFLYSEGLVYPSSLKYTCTTFEVPTHWKRIVAYDYGLSDDSVFLFGAVDEINNLLYIYKERRMNNKNVEELSRIFHQETKEIPVGGWICPPIIDPKSGVKRDYDKKTLIDHFVDFGISFKPGHINLDARIYRLNTYFECGKIRIMDCCTGLISELRDYKFKAKNLDSQGWDNKPEDKNNHAINPLEWITMELPSDPNKLIYGIYNRYGQDVAVKQDIEKQFQIHALSDDEDSSGRETAFEMSDYNFNF